MKILAYLFFALGTMIAISGGAKMPKPEETFPDTFPIFIGGAILAAVGVVLWRYALRMERQAETANSHDHDAPGSPFSYLADVVAPAQALCSELEQLDRHSLLTRVDELLENYILPFAEVRQGVIDRLGMTKGAEILVTVAFGERMLNRTWSAASDEHMPEARACLPDAVEAFEEAHRLVQKNLG